MDVEPEYGLVKFEKKVAVVLMNGNSRSNSFLFFIQIIEKIKMIKKGMDVLDICELAECSEEYVEEVRRSI